MMLLRTRITLMVSAIALVVIFALVAEGNWRERSARADMDAARIQIQVSAWAALTQNALQPLEELARAASRDGALTAALVAGDATAALAIVKRLQAEAGGSVAAAGVEIVAADGARVVGAGGEAALTSAVVTAAGRNAGVLSGILHTATGAPVLAAVAPLYSRSGLAGAVAVTVDPLPTVKQLAAALGADVALTDGAGAFAAASAGRPWPAKLLAAARDVERGASMLVDGGRRLEVTWTTVADIAGERPAVLLSVNDVTEAARRRFWLSAISLGGVVSAAVLFLAFLHWYMRRAFRPLHRVIRMLHALARGERAVPPTSRRATTRSAGWRPRPPISAPASRPATNC